jgi:alpha-beta hydrolase superfamily lysophospholipase
VFRRRRSSRTIARPTKLGVHDGLSYALYRPDRDPLGGVVVLHGAGSCKESHFDFAREAQAWGFAAIAFDMRGHGASEGELGAGASDDIAAIASLLPRPLALRGSSMGGYLALIAAEQLDARAIVAICPAAAGGLSRGLRAGAFDFRADTAALEQFFAAHDEMDAAAELRAPLLLLHAEGDEQVPIEHSRALLEEAGSETKRLIALPGGHHRSVQHDGDMMFMSLRFIERALAS